MIRNNGLKWVKVDYNNTKCSRALCDLITALNNFSSLISFQDYQKQLKASHLEMEALGKTNDQLRISMNKSEEQVKVGSVQISIQRQHIN